MGSRRRTLNPALQEAGLPGPPSSDKMASRVINLAPRAELGPSPLYSSNSVAYEAACPIEGTWKRAARTVGKAWTESGKSSVLIRPYLCSAILPSPRTYLDGSEFFHLQNGNDSKAVLALPSSHEGL